MLSNRASPAPLVYARPPLDARAYGRDLEPPPCSLHIECPDTAACTAAGRCCRLTKTIRPPEPPSRVIVVDDGASPRLAVYAGAELIAAVRLDPGRALRLAEKLILVARQTIENPPA